MSAYTDCGGGICTNVGGECDACREARAEEPERDETDCPCPIWASSSPCPCDAAPGGGICACCEADDHNGRCATIQ